MVYVYYNNLHLIINSLEYIFFFINLKPTLIYKMSNFQIVAINAYFFICTIDHTLLFTIQHKINCI